jgi:hypothetical protein
MLARNEIVYPRSHPRARSRSPSPPPFIPQGVGAVFSGVHMLQAIVPFLSQECAFDKKFWKLLQFAHNAVMQPAGQSAVEAVLQGELTTR